MDLAASCKPERSGLMDIIAMEDMGRRYMGHLNLDTTQPEGACAGCAKRALIGQIVRADFNIWWPTTMFYRFGHPLHGRTVILFIDRSAGTKEVSSGIEVVTRKEVADWHF